MTRDGRPGSNGSTADRGEGGSGRVLVSAAAVVVLVVWGGLSLAFRQWREHYRERAAYGAARVAGSIEALTAVVPADEVAPALRAVASAGAAAVAPPGIGPGAWIGAVQETRARLVTLTASNVLGVAQMDSLADRVAVRVARARPATARAELAGLWDEVEAEAGPVIDRRHARPVLLRPRGSGPPRDDATTRSH